jgi:hypothetical protein
MLNYTGVILNQGTITIYLFGLAFLHSSLTVLHTMRLLIKSGKRKLLMLLNQMLNNFTEISTMDVLNNIFDLKGK